MAVYAAQHKYLIFLRRLSNNNKNYITSKKSLIPYYTL
jgi:hypothetical protein